MAAMTKATEPKRVRGRPRLVPTELMKFNRSVYPQVHTDRQHQNIFLAVEAMRILGLLPEGGDLPPPTWLVDWEGANRGKRGAVKWSVLEQLGRMARAGFDEQDVRDYAAAIDERRLGAKDAAARLRQIRLDWPGADDS
jgi:hypothetical protein